MAYIDVELLLQDISDSVVFSVRGFDDPEIRGAKKIIDRIRKAPVVDVVEVVRCKECKHSIGEHPILQKTMCILDACSKPYKHYCGCGERKDT